LFYFNIPLFCFICAEDTNYHKYQCCPQGVQPDDKPAAEPTTPAVPPGCRWTGCEHNDWAQKGE
jgi:hypothetical protein